MAELTKIDRELLSQLTPGEWFSPDPLGSPRPPWRRGLVRRQEYRADRLHELGFLAARVVRHEWYADGSHKTYLQYRLKPEHAAMGKEVA